MGRRHEISGADWDRIAGLLCGQPGRHGGVADDNRRFVNAVPYAARTGIPWRDLPERLGPWNTQWRRFDRWAKAGRFAALAAVFRDPDLDLLVLDSAVIRAHPRAAGRGKSGTGPGARRSRPSAAAGAGSGPSCTGAATASGDRSSRS
jgi:transposase